MGRPRRPRVDPSQRVPAGYLQQGLVVRLASLPWMALGVVVLGGSATIPLGLGMVLILVNCAGALYLADYLLRLRAAGGGLHWLAMFFSTPVLALLYSIAL
ncbi:hypothetical protein [Stenotrophomonas geniculata]|uniref:hypothetical protein n=1 Tax=Stenotrophomonas geniculata TaxID=86188 RepID=UPI000A779E5C|nr:hypothetical protein [Stenotrophomonas geniculata]